MLDGNGALVSGSKTSYWPFGAVRSGGSALGDKLYTGQQKESDDGLGLYDYGARFYSTTLGRFAAVDPIIGSASDPQSWNAYSYVRNNPLSYVDPTGMDPASDWVHSGSIGQERDTGCGPTCEALIALDSVGLHSADEVAAYQHEQLVGALLLLSAEASLTEQWTTSNSIANGGGSDCDTACQWMAAARGYQDAAEKQHEDLVAALWFLSESISKQRSANCESCVWIVTGVTESGTQARPVYAYPVTDPVSSYVESRLNELRDPATIATLVMLVASGGESGIEPEGLEPEFEEPPVRNANEPQRRPGSAGESKGTDALRAHNQRLQDAARDAGLTRQQTRRFHEDYDSRDPDMSYADLVKAAQMYRYGN
jgi:RHS repeat-associated protein